MRKFIRRFVSKKRGMEALQSILILAVAALLLTMLKGKGKEMATTSTDAAANVAKQ